MATLLERIAALQGSPEGVQALRWLVPQAEAMVKTTKRRGRARGRGQSSKAKGRSAVVAVRDRIAAVLGVNPETMHVKATSQLGCDLFIAPETLARFPFAVEVKNVESLNIWAALAQAHQQAPEGQVPVVFFKRAGTSLYAALTADSFLALVQRAYPAD
jgi:hypothetical protein